MDITVPVSAGSSVGGYKHKDLYCHNIDRRLRGPLSSGALLQRQCHQRPAAATSGMRKTTRYACPGQIRCPLTIGA